ncbi:hypothetical protein [Proteus sp. FME41]|uniref:hypothetical protein n=1 Tax=Proteus sp. FME41 TaxID=2742608 RepID=UPI00186868E8|nr:hypothetical protein [Proteus sp. FME41]
MNVAEEIIYMDMSGNGRYLNTVPSLKLNFVNLDNSNSDTQHIEGESDDSDYVDFNEFINYPKINKNNIYLNQNFSKENTKIHNIKNSKEEFQCFPAVTKSILSPTLFEYKNRISEKNNMITHKIMKNELIDNEIMVDKEVINNMSHKELSNIYTNEIDRYFSLIHLMNQSDDIISPQIKKMLNYQLNVLQNGLSDEEKSFLLNIRMKIIINLSALINYSNFKNELLLETNKNSFHDLISREDGHNYSLTNLFSNVLKKNNKDIDFSKIKDIKKINDISNSIISLVLAKYDKEGII